MTLGRMTKAQDECEAEDGRWGWCVFTTDDESIGACYPSAFDIVDDFHLDCEDIAVLS